MQLNRTVNKQYSPGWTDLVYNFDLNLAWANIIFSRIACSGSIASQKRGTQVYLDWIALAIKLITWMNWITFLYRD